MSMQPKRNLRKTPRFQARNLEEPNQRPRESRSSDCLGPNEHSAKALSVDDDADGSGLIENGVLTLFRPNIDRCHHGRDCFELGLHDLDQGFSLAHG